MLLPMYVCYLIIFFSSYLWFVGEMSRDKADKILSGTENGTYLLRVRTQGPTYNMETAFALSLK